MLEPIRRVPSRSGSSPRDRIARSGDNADGVSAQHLEQSIRANCVEEMGYRRQTPVIGVHDSKCTSAKR